MLNLQLQLLMWLTISWECEQWAHFLWVLLWTMNCELARLSELTFFSRLANIYTQAKTLWQRALAGYPEGQELKKDRIFILSRRPPYHRFWLRRRWSWWIRTISCTLYLNCCGVISLYTFPWYMAFSLGFDPLQSHAILWFHNSLVTVMKMPRWKWGRRRCREFVWFPLWGYREYLTLK